MKIKDLSQNEHLNLLMKKYIYDENYGLWYELQGNYHVPCLTPPEEGTQPIRLWGQRHRDYLKEHGKVIYATMRIEGKLNSYLAEIDKQAEEMCHRLMKDMADRQGMTEKLKAEQPMEWIGRMGNIQACARGAVNSELIYT